MINKTIERFPLIDKKLIQILDELFPDRCPEPTQDDRQIWMARGSVEVVRLLKRVKEYQDSAFLSRPVSISE